jgi:hypothetical protein
VNLFGRSALKDVMTPSRDLITSATFACLVTSGCTITTFEAQPVLEDDPTFRIAFIDPDEHAEAEQEDRAEIIVVEIADPVRGAWVLQIIPETQQSELMRVLPDGAEQPVEVQFVDRVHHPRGMRFESWKSIEEADDDGTE